MRWSRPCGLMVTPTAAAACARASTVACGVASQPKTSACAKAAPVSLEARCTKPVLRASASAVVVTTSCSVWARSAIVVMGKLLCAHEVLYTLMMPKRLPSSFLTLMRIGVTDPFVPHFSGI